MLIYRHFKVVNMSLTDLHQDLYREVLSGVPTVPYKVRTNFPNESTVSRENFYNLMRGSSGVLYQQERQQSGEKKGYLSQMGDYFKHLYNRTGEWFIEKPYKGLGALGAIIGGALGLAAGPLGVLFGGAIVGSILGGLGAGYYWSWGRGKRIPGNTEFLKGRSLGKWFADYIQTMEAQRRTQPTG